MGLVHIVVNGVGVAIETSLQVIVKRKFLGNLLHKVGDDLAFFVTPWLLAAPVGVELCLYLSHLCGNGFLSKLLQLGVERGVDFQS